MFELDEELWQWCQREVAFAVATLVGVRGSAPQALGAFMAVNSEGQVLGGLSGGCIEGAVYDLATSLLPGDAPRLATYGLSDEEALGAGLSCGGTLEVLVAPFGAQDRALLGEVISSRKRAEPVALALVTMGERLGASLGIWPDRVEGSLGTGQLDLAVTAEAQRLLTKNGENVVLRCSHSGDVRARPPGPAAVGLARGEMEVFVQAFLPPPRLIVCGASDLASALARLGCCLGYRVTICDARALFAVPARFGEAAEIVCDWPHRYLFSTAVDERTVICVLTHDPKFDVPALEVALRGPAAYVGALGSRPAHEHRLGMLRAAGLGTEELRRLSSPVGLDIGAVTPEEVAVSILADVVRRRRGGTGLPLTARSGPIHSTPSVSGHTTLATR